MAKDPAFLFYSSDFLTGTMFMNNEQTGIYIRLLCSQHQHGGIIDKISFEALVGQHMIIKAKFIETETGFYNERLTEEMEKRNKKSNNMSETAREVWKIRKIQLHNKSKEKEYKSNSKVKENDTIVMQPEDENEDVNRNKDIIKKEKEKTEKIIEYLNQKLGSNYKSNSKHSKSLIPSRLKEGFSVEDFYSVIDHKFLTWGEDEKMKEYLRPETLFGSKFEGYLQASKITIVKMDKIDNILSANNHVKNLYKDEQ